MTDETQLLLVDAGLAPHIVDREQPDRTFCNRPLKGNHEYGHPYREDLKPSPWHGDAEPRQRTLADHRSNHYGHTFGVCNRCLKKAGVTA